MKLHLIGDVHGKIGLYLNIINQIPIGDKSIQLGDMGMGFPRHPHELELPEMLSDHRFIRGNHDGPEASRAHPNYLSDWGYNAVTKIFHVAGAFSIDYAWRVESVSWWRDEELSYAELDKAVDLYAAMKPEIVLSHECPSSITEVMLATLAVGNPYFAGKMECKKSRTGAALQRMFEIHQPKKWFFAHYHIDRIIERNGTTFRCIAELSHTSIEVPDVPITLEPKPVVGFINPEAI